MSDIKGKIGIILEDGEVIEITYPFDIEEELFNEMREAQSKDEFWNVGNYSDALAMYKGCCVSNINMKRVIGTT